MITKTQIIESLKDLPENLTVEEVIERLIVIEKVRKGLTDSDEGKVYNKSESDRRLKKWLK